MAEKTIRRNGTANELQTAMALLIQNQARFVGHIDEDRRRFARIEREFVEIRKELDTIKAVLVRHETMLEKLPEAIREKIGFKT